MAQVPSGVERGGNAAACIREGAKDPKLTPSEPNPKHEAPPWRDSMVTSHRPLEPIRVMISRGSESGCQRIRARSSPADANFTGKFKPSSPGVCRGKCQWPRPGSARAAAV